MKEKKEEHNKENDNDEKKQKLHDIKQDVNEKKDEKDEKKTKRRGRRKKAEVEKEKEISEALTGTGSFVLNILISRMPNPSPLSSEETKNFDIVFDRVVNKYISYLGNYSEEFALLTVTTIILIPRMKKKENLEKENNTDFR